MSGNDKLSFLFCAYTLKPHNLNNYRGPIRPGRSERSG
jgi:hypothetical protein